MDLTFEIVLARDADTFFPADLADFGVDNLLVDLALEDAALLETLALVEPTFTDFALVSLFAADFVPGAGIDRSAAVDCGGRERIGHEPPSRLQLNAFLRFFSMVSGDCCSVA